MVAGKVKEELTNETILKRISEFDIYRYYVGEDFPIGKMIHSPMPGRKDNHPSFLIGNRAGFMYHIDFADGRLKGNCFQFVMQKEMLPNYDSALRKIDKDFNLGIREGKLEDVKAPVFIQPTLIETEQKFFQVQYTSKLNLEEKRYWDEYYITPIELEENDIYVVKKLWIDRQLQPMKLGELCFGYKEGPLWKIYRPTACRRRKWLNNMTLDTIEGLDKIVKAEKGVVTKSRKDRVVLKKFIKDVISVQNESLHALPPDKAKIISDNWDEVYVNYDNDEAGKKNSWIVTKEYGYRHINVPDSYLSENITDPSDLIKAYGPDTVYNYLQSKNLIK